MADRDYKAFIVEGEAREPLIIDNISKVFFSHGNFKIITLPAGQNIYMLWKKLKEDDFDTDIIEVLREEHKELEEQLTGLSREDFSEVYLFFDFDGHQNNLGVDDDGDVLEQMLINFDNETEHGKLYLSYPMVEALRDFEMGVCGNKENCFVMNGEIEKYKYLSAEHSKYPQFKEYDFEIWKNVMDVFAMRLSCLMKQEKTLTYEQYIEAMSPYEVLRLEKQDIQNNRVFVLSAFPEFLLDYFGRKLWKKCVKSTKKLFCNNFNIEMS
ncbi:MAG: hypothetical protein J6A77_03140 [Lachnospiraceae bacterium]|nr:hypothetical protein [Lachnospiraceae bacterium]